MGLPSVFAHVFNIFGTRAAQCAGGWVPVVGQCVDGGFAVGVFGMGSEGVRVSKNGLNRVVIGSRLL